MHRFPDAGRLMLAKIHHQRIAAHPPAHEEEICARAARVHAHHAGLNAADEIGVTGQLHGLCIRKIAKKQRYGRQLGAFAAKAHIAQRMGDLLRGFKDEVDDVKKRALFHRTSCCARQNGCAAAHARIKKACPPGR